MLACELRIALDFVGLGNGARGCTTITQQTAD